MYANSILDEKKGELTFAVGANVLIVTKHSQVYECHVVVGHSQH